MRAVLLSKNPIKPYSIQECIVKFAKWNSSTLRNSDLPTRSTLRVSVHAGRRSKFSVGAGGGGGGRDAKEERRTKFGTSHAWQFLFNFFIVTGNAFITIKLLISFVDIFSDVGIGSQNSPSLNWNAIDCCWHQPLKTVLRKYARWLDSLCFYNSIARALDAMMARAKRIYSLIIKVNLLKEIEIMFSVFLWSYRNTHESLGELEKAVETLACGSCSNVQHSSFS